ncbi:unnamed protein product [Symbiodinium sp. KB8]|nr:unnamed protein product [Symbiodinium sp. KB8]
MKSCFRAGDRHVRHTPSQVGCKWSWAEAGPCGKVSAPRAGSQRGAHRHFPCTSIAAMTATAVHGFRGLRGRRRGKRSVMAADESENEREAPSSLQTALDKISKEWHEFWFGEYWSEEVPVTVGPLTVVGVILLLYGIEYFLADSVKSVPNMMQCQKIAEDRSVAEGCLRVHCNVAGEGENSVPDSIGADGGPAPGTPGGSCSTDDIEEQNHRGGRSGERTTVTRSSSGAGRAGEAVIDFTDSWSTLLRNLLTEEGCKSEECRVFNRHGELIPVFFDKDFVPTQRDFPLHVTFRKETKLDWRVSESDEAIKTATSAASFISEEQEEVRRAASSVASAETDDEVPTHLQVVAKSLRHWLAEMKCFFEREHDDLRVCFTSSGVDGLRRLPGAGHSAWLTMDGHYALHIAARDQAFTFAKQHMQVFGLIPPPPPAAPTSKAKAKGDGRGTAPPAVKPASRATLSAMAEIKTDGASTASSNTASG